MTDSKPFTPFDFFRLAREMSQHEVEMKIKLARAGFQDRSAPAADAR